MRSAAPLLVLLVAFIALAQAGTLISAGLLAIGTQDQYVVALDTESGNDKILVRTFQADGQPTFDQGVSALDDVHGVYYYAVNWPASLIVAADLNGKTVLPPIYVGPSRIVNLAYNADEGVLYALTEQGNLFSVDASSIQPLGALPSSVDSHVRVAVAFLDGQYTILGKTHIGSNTTWALTYWNMQPNPDVIPLNSSAPLHGWPQWMVSDNMLRTAPIIFAVSEAGPALGPNIYYVWEIDYMGHTTQSAPLGLPSSAYVALYTYDITNHVIWLGAYIGETNSNALYSYNVLTQTLSDPVPVTFDLLTMDFSSNMTRWQ